MSFPLQSRTMRSLDQCRHSLRVMAQVMVQATARATARVSAEHLGRFGVSNMPGCMLLRRGRPAHCANAQPGKERHTPGWWCKTEDLDRRETGSHQRARSRGVYILMYRYLAMDCGQTHQSDPTQHARRRIRRRSLCSIAL